MPFAKIKENLLRFTYDSQIRQWERLPNLTEESLLVARFSLSLIHKDHQNFSTSPRSLLLSITTKKLHRSTEEERKLETFFGHIFICKRERERMRRAEHEFPDGRIKAQIPVFSLFFSLNFGS